MYLETLQQMYASTSKVMIDAKSGGNLLYLPLDKLMQVAAGTPAAGTGAADAQQSGASRAVSPAPTISGDVPPQVERSAPGDPRSRDRLISRERGDR
jgi:membrane protease subunit HflK